MVFVAKAAIFIPIGITLRVLAGRRSEIQPLTGSLARDVACVKRPAADDVWRLA